MSLPSSTFSSQYAGKLQIVVAAHWYDTRYSDAGFPNTNSNANLQLKAFAGPSGSYSYSTPFDKNNPSVTFELDYPGGSVSWNWGVQEVAHQSPTSGIWSYGFDAINVTAKLIKK